MDVRRSFEWFLVKTAPQVLVVGKGFNAEAQKAQRTQSGAGKFIQYLRRSFRWFLANTAPQVLGGQS
jgi:hypothetical protein